MRRARGSVAGHRTAFDPEVQPRHARYGNNQDNGGNFSSIGHYQVPSLGMSQAKSVCVHLPRRELIDCLAIC